MFDNKAMVHRLIQVLRLEIQNAIFAFPSDHEIYAIPCPMGVVEGLVGGSPAIRMHSREACVTGDFW